MLKNDFTDYDHNQFIYQTHAEISSNLGSILQIGHNPCNCETALHSWLTATSQPMTADFSATHQLTHSHTMTPFDTPRKQAF